MEAKLCWPRGTAKVVAGITGKDERSYYRWRNGRTRMSGEDLIALTAAIRADYERRGRMFQQFTLDL